MSAVIILQTERTASRNISKVEHLSGEQFHRVRAIFFLFWKMQHQGYGSDSHA